MGRNDTDARAVALDDETTQRLSLDRARSQAHKVHLHKLVRLSPYMVLFVAPGGFLILPVLAWWLDRRRLQQDEENAALKTSTEKSQS